MGMLFGKFWEWFLFVLFLYGGGVWSEKGIILLKWFEGECVVRDYGEFI